MKLHSCPNIPRILVFITRYPPKRQATHEHRRYVCTLDYRSIHQQVISGVTRKEGPKGTRSLNHASRLLPTAIVSVCSTLMNRISSSPTPNKAKPCYRAQPNECENDQGHHPSKQAQECCNETVEKSGLLELLAPLPDHVIGQRRHPQAFLNHALDRLERVSRASIDELQQALDNDGRRTMPLEVDERLAARGAGDESGLLRIGGEVVNV